MKHAQTEIIGLVIIAVILVLAFAFFLSFHSTEPSLSKRNILVSQKAQTTMSAMMKTTSLCGKLENIVRDCFEGNNICPGTDSCYYAKDRLGNLLNSTLPRDDAIFTAELEDESFSVSTRGCTMSDENTGSAIAFIPSSKGTIKIVLSICN